MVPVLEHKKSINWDDVKTIQEVYVIGTATERAAIYKSLPGADRIGVNFDFDITNATLDQLCYSSDTTKFRNVATLTHPKTADKNGTPSAYKPFRSAALQYPWVYVQTRENDDSPAQLHVFQLPAPNAEKNEN